MKKNWMRFQIEEAVKKEKVQVGYNNKKELKRFWNEFDCSVKQS